MILSSLARRRRSFREPPPGSVVELSDERYKYRFAAHSKKEANRARRLFEKERGTIAWIDRELRPDDVFYDIGANIGVYTIYAARRLGPGGQVVAFEPHIPNASSLVENIFLNEQQERVRLVSAALTDHTGYAPFNYQSVQAGSSTSQYDGRSYEGESFNPVFCEIKHGCTVDALCEQGLIPPPDLVKIDVDGLDFEVLDGMRGLLASDRGPRAVQVELGSDSKPRILELCERLGYELKEKHWSQAGLSFIEEGGDPEAYPHYGIFGRGRGERFGSA